MKTQALLAAATLLVALPAAVLPAVAAGPAHLVADLAPGLEPYQPSIGQADFNGYRTVGGRILFFGFQPEGDGFRQCGLWTVDPLSGAAERLADLCPAFRVPLHWLATGGALGYLADAEGRLWRTDGTAAGTFMLGVQVGGDSYDPFGAYSFDPPALGPDGRTLFFQGCTADAGCELWRSDGSLRGTYLLRDLAPGSASSFPAGFLRDGRRILFGVLGALWSTDGTAAGTLRLTPIRAAGQPKWLLDKPQPHAGKLYFFASGVFAGQKDLWVYDPQSPRSPQARRLHTFISGLFSRGVFAGPQARRLHGFSDELFSRASADFEAVGGRLFILAFDESDSTLPLWEVTDTPAGLTKVGPPFAFTGFSLLHEAGGRIVFAASQGREAPSLWTLSPGMKRPLPLTGCPAPGGCPAPDNGLTPAVEVNGRLFFSGRDAAHGRELWVTDGTAAGTRRVEDLCPGACDGGPVQMSPALGGVVFTDRQGFLWASDGTAAGTVRLADTGIIPPLFNTPPLELAEAGGRIVFTALDPATGRQPFVSDLTPAGTHLLAPIGSTLPASSSPSGLSPLGAKVLFLACAAGTNSVWISDGTAAGTFTIPGTAEPCSAGGPPLFSERVGHLTFFDWQGKLWRTDGTAAGTFPVLTLPAGVFSVLHRVAFGGKLLFLLPPPGFPSADDGSGWTFWTSDGTPEGTAAAFSLQLGSAPWSFAAGGEGEVLLTALLPGSPGPPTLWRTDGTAAGTRILLPDAASLLETARLGGTTYFLNDGGPGANLWTTDGTAAGTRPIVPEDAPEALVGAYDLTVFDGALYFFAGGYSNGGDPPQPPQALWRSDGTPAGTRIVKTIDLHREPFAGQLQPELTVAGGHLFFRAEDADHGAELWTSDGTPEGTTILKDIHPGPDSSLPDGLTAAGGRLYFAATDGEHGVELWQSDGTAEGTVMVQDLFPGSAPSNPEQLTGADGFLYFTAQDGVHGREPWVLPLPR